MEKVAAVVMVILTIFVSYLFSLVGMSIPWAIFCACIALALVAIVVSVVALSEFIFALGVVWLVLAQFDAFVLVNEAFPGHPKWLLALSTLGVEAVIMTIVGVIGFSSFLRLRRRHQAAARRRMASANGWRYERRGPVVVTGPMTARRLPGVPDYATTADEPHVVRGIANGYEFTIFDTFPLAYEYAGRTVWQIRLPVTFPDPVSTNTIYAQLRERVPSLSEKARIDKIWVEANYLFAFIRHGGLSLPRPDVVARDTRELTALVAALPWDELRPATRT